MWVNNLTVEEKDAVEYYTGHGYSSINKYLRGTVEPTLRVIDFERNLHKALNKYELKENFVFNRFKF